MAKVLSFPPAGRAEQQSEMDEYRKLVESRVAEEQSELRDGDEEQGFDGGSGSGGSGGNGGGGGGGNSGGSDGFDLAYIRKCYNANTVGDSILYNRLCCGKFVFHVKDNRWWRYVGPHWVIDDTGRAKHAVELVVEQYLRLVAEIEERIAALDGEDGKGKAGKIKSLGANVNKILKRIDRLRTPGGRKDVLECAISNSEPLTVTPEELDTDPWVLPVRNGVIDLRTGDFREGRPEDYITVVADVDWQGIDAPCPTWENLLQTSIANEDSVAFLQRALGYGMTGDHERERFFLVFHGQHGQNGKGTIVERLYKLLGSLAAPIQTEMLMSQRFVKSADGPSPAVMGMKGKRIVGASETEENHGWAVGKIKWFSGGDKLLGRYPNDKDQIYFYPTHTLIIYCNTLPHAPAHDNGFWLRIKVIDFPFSFVQKYPTRDTDGNEVQPVYEKHEKPADPLLSTKLDLEGPGILAWLIRGCMEWHRTGLAPSKKVIEDSQKYRRTEDDIQDFIEQCCDIAPPEKAGDPEYEVRFKDLYKRYKDWHEEMFTHRALGSKKFGTLLSLKFEKSKSSTIKYFGLRLRFDLGDRPEPAGEV